jgi:hypothetical protein
MEHIGWVRLLVQDFFNDFADFRFVLPFVSDLAKAIALLSSCLLSIRLFFNLPSPE